METMTETIQRIVAKIGEVRRRGLTCFGSDHHRFSLNSPITEAGLQKFEREHGSVSNVYTVAEVARTALSEIQET